MINAFINYIQSIVVGYGTLGIFVAALIEQIIVFIPSSFVPITAGFFILPAYGLFLDVLWKSIYTIALPVAFGTALGSLIFYFLGYLGGKPIIEKTKKWFGLNWEDVEKIKKKLDNSRSDELTLFILWTLPILPTVVIAVSCGIFHYSLLKHILLTISGIFLRATAMSMVGWQMGELYYIAVKRIEFIENYLLIAFGLLILVGVIFLFYKKQYIVKK
jgi:membrane protein DedA with SNARE-associated domain